MLKMAENVPCVSSPFNRGPAELINATPTSNLQPIRFMIQIVALNSLT